MVWVISVSLILGKRIVSNELSEGLKMAPTPSGFFEDARLEP